MSSRDNEYFSTMRVRTFMDSEIDRSNGQEESDIRPNEQTSGVQNQSVTSVIPMATSKILKLRVSGSEHLVYFVQWKPESIRTNKE